MSSHPSVTIRVAQPSDYGFIGALVAEVYAGLPGMPSEQDQPSYYAMLRNVASRADNPCIQVLVAVDASGAILGCVDFISDMKHYGSEGSATRLANAAGIRLLAVDPQRRGLGVGRTLTERCIDEARRMGRSSVILHTTRAMQVAWRMYEKLGFQRLSSIDFRQGDLDVFGFELTTDQPRKSPT